ncbi:MAG: molecular chaperone TorD family protein [Planctomycetes bacterium]|nr:molecular chaperone TorD family protein [Planctomycetota bacterium]
MNKSNRNESTTGKIDSVNGEVPYTGRGASGMKRETCSANEDAKARGDMYRFLSSVYLYPPSEEIIRQIVAESSIEELSHLFGEQAIAGLREFASTVNIDTDLALLKQEFMELFKVPTGRYVTPFEDVYRGATAGGKQGKGPLMGECAVKVKKMYRQAGTEIEKECLEVPTHIGVELSFMCFLCEKEFETIMKNKLEVSPEQAEAVSVDSINYHKFQVKFLKEHLAEWFPQLSQSIQAKTKNEYYRSLVIITEKFLVQDVAFLSDVGP